MTFTWILVVMGIIGVILNNHKRIECFYLWGIPRRVGVLSTGIMEYTASRFYLRFISAWQFMGGGNGGRKKHAEEKD